MVTCSAHDQWELIWELFIAKIRNQANWEGHQRPRMSSHQPSLVEIGGVILVASYWRAFELELGQGHHRGSKNTPTCRWGSFSEKTVTQTIGDGMAHKCMCHAWNHSRDKDMHHAHSRFDRFEVVASHITDISSRNSMGAL